jgi:hypothetical protein
MRISLLGLVALVVAAGAAPGTLAAQRVAPSVYVGFGSYTNLGGEVGLGTEVRVGPVLSVSAAAGFLTADREFDAEEGRVGFDAGVKAYPFRNWLFLGLNYGLVDYWVDTRPTPARIEKTHAFSFTAGARSPAWRRLYGSAFFGITSDAEANRFFGSFAPRVGVTTGYELTR